MAIPFGSNRLEKELVVRSMARAYESYDRGGYCVLCNKSTCYQGACEAREARREAAQFAAESYDHWAQPIREKREQFGWCPPNPWGAAGAPGAIH